MDSILSFFFLLFYSKKWKQYDDDDTGWWSWRKILSLYSAKWQNVEIECNENKNMWENRIEKKKNWLQKFTDMGLLHTSMKKNRKEEKILYYYSCYLFCIPFVQTILSTQVSIICNWSFSFSFYAIHGLLFIHCFFFSLAGYLHYTSSFSPFYMNR